MKYEGEWVNDKQKIMSLNEISINNTKELFYKDLSDIDNLTINVREVFFLYFLLDKRKFSTLNQ